MNPGKRPPNWLLCACFLTLASISFSYGVSYAQTSYEMIPSISASATYNDNINLSNTNETSDYISTLSPSISLNMLSERNNLNFQYAPTFVWYENEDQNNTVRHLGNLTFARDLTQRWTFNLTDTYIMSEDPIEDIDDVGGDRDTINQYWRNTGRAWFDYLFGRENTLNLGYNLSIVDNQDVTLNDSTIQTLFAGMTYWFDMRNGLEVNYEYNLADFSQAEGFIASDDNKGHAAVIRYRRRFNPNTSGSLSFILTTREFTGLTEDYNIYEGSAGFEHTFSPELTLALDTGYFIRKGESSETEGGWTFDASLIKNFQRGLISFNASGGWDEDFLGRTNRVFIQYGEGNVRFEYLLTEKLNSYAGGYYRYERNDTSQDRQILRGNIGLSWSFLRLFTLSLDYAFADRNDDVETQSYTNNRILLRLTAGKPYRW